MIGEFVNLSHTSFGSSVTRSAKPSVGEVGEERAAEEALAIENHTVYTATGFDPRRVPPQ
jgi:hypothetical protein